MSIFNSGGSFGLGSSPTPSVPFGSNSNYQDALSLLQNNQPNMDPYIQTEIRPTGPFGTGPIRFNRPVTPQDPNNVSFREGMFAALMGDRANMEQARDFNFGRTDQANQDYLDNVLSGADDIRAGGQEAFDFMTGIGGNLSQIGEDAQSEIRDVLAEGRRDLQQYTGGLASSVGAGMDRRLESGNAALLADAKAGNPMAQQQMQDNIAQAEADRVGVISNLGLNIAQTESQYALGEASGLAQAAGVRANFESMANQANTLGTQMRQASIANAANFEAQGHMNMAQMIAANPFHPVSLAETLATFFSFMSNPMSGQMPDLPGGVLA